jgi:ADP-heptose:LPS heptosyltransferase
MEFFARASAILTFLSGARRRAGLHRFTSEGPYRGDLFTHRIPHNPHLHVAVAYHTMVEALELPESRQPLPKRRIAQRDWAPPLLQIEPAEAQHVVQTLGLVSKRIVLLNPNASDLLPLRRWPTERFVELGKRLLAEDPGLTIVVTGAPSEKEAAEEIALRIDPLRAICAAGSTTLRELLVLYSLADVLVTNDSGPGHFASMTNIEVVVMFGPETPELFGPLGPRIRVITADLACSPCVNALNHRFSPCNDNVCMQQISVDEVHRAVTDALYRRRKAAKPVLRVLPAALTQFTELQRVAGARA